MNSQIAVRGAMIMNHLAVYCTANNVPLPKIYQALLYDAFNYDPRYSTGSIKNEHLRNVVEQSINIIPRPTHDDGCSRGNLIDNLVRLYLANIKASIKDQGKMVFNHQKQHQHSSENLPSRSHQK